MTISKPNLLNQTFLNTMNMDIHRDRFK